MHWEVVVTWNCEWDYMEQSLMKLGNLIPKYFCTSFAYRNSFFSLVCKSLFLPKETVIAFPETVEL